MAKGANQPHLFDDGSAGPVRRVRRGVDGTIRALRATGRLEAVDAATIALARTLSDAIDDEHTDPDGSRFTVGALAGRLHPILADLRAINLVGVDDYTAALFAPLPDAPHP